MPNQINKASNSNHGNVSFFAKYATMGGQVRKFGITDADRLRHMYVIGKTGVGKSTLLENLAIQDIRRGNGIAMVDPHGSTADRLLRHVPKERIDDVVIFDPSDVDNPIAFNVLERVDYSDRHRVASSLLAIFKRIWPDSFSARMEYLLSNAILALLEHEESTLLSVNRLMLDKSFRKNVVSGLKDPVVKDFWLNDFGKWSDRFRTEATQAIQNKIGQFASNPVIRNIIGQKKSSFDLRKIMDEKKILIIKLPIGLLGEDNLRLLGSMMVAKLYIAGMSRANLSEEELKLSPPFFMYVDEFQNFATDSFADFLSSSRKYKVGLILAHQYIDQLEESIKYAVFGNVGTLISFRVGVRDAEFLEGQFSPTFTVGNLTSLGRYEIILTLLVDGLSTEPFMANTLPPLEPTGDDFSDIIRARSRSRYTNKRDDVEREIRDWFLRGGGARNENDGVRKRGARAEKSKSAFGGVGLPESVSLDELAVGGVGEGHKDDMKGLLDKVSGIFADADKSVADGVAGTERNLTGNSPHGKNVGIGVSDGVADEYSASPRIDIGEEIEVAEEISDADEGAGLVDEMMMFVPKKDSGDEIAGAEDGGLRNDVPAGDISDNFGKDSVPKTDGAGRDAIPGGADVGATSDSEVASPPPSDFEKSDAELDAILNSGGMGFPVMPEGFDEKKMLDAVREIDEKKFAEFLNSDMFIEGMKHIAEEYGMEDMIGDLDPDLMRSQMMEMMKMMKSGKTMSDMMGGLMGGGMLGGGGVNAGAGESSVGGGEDGDDNSGANTADSDNLVPGRNSNISGTPHLKREVPEDILKSLLD